MLMEEEDADPSYFDDMAKIEKSFKKIGEEPNGHQQTADLYRQGVGVVFDDEMKAEQYRQHRADAEADV